MKGGRADLAQSKLRRTHRGPHGARAGGRGVRAIELAKNLGNENTNARHHFVVTLLLQTGHVLACVGRGEHAVGLNER